MEGGALPLLGRRGAAYRYGCRRRRCCAPLHLSTLPGPQPRLRRRFYIPEGAGRGQGAVVPVFVAFPDRVWGMPGARPGSRWSAQLDERPGGRSCSRLTLDQAGNGYWGVARPVRRSCPWQARGCIHPFGGARSWWLRGHGAGSHAGSGINQTRRPPAGGGGQ
jgi:hypothetical protein